MMLVDGLVLLALLLSFLSGLKDGAVKSFFSVVSLVIALPISGAVYPGVVGWFTFLPGKDWDRLVGFFITLAIVSLLLSLVFQVPRKIVQTVWSGGCLFRVLGGAINLLNGAIGLTVLTLVLVTYPAFDWLTDMVANSSVLTWLVRHLGFVRVLLPGDFWGIPGAAVLMWSRH